MAPRCRHRKKNPGPRVPAVYGTFPTVVCVACGAWKIAVGRDRWRRGPVPRTREKETNHA